MDKMFEELDMKPRERLKLAREDMCLSQRGAAKMTGISPSMYSMLERGERELRPKYVYMISDKLGLSVDWIRFGRGPRMAVDCKENMRR